MNIPSNSDSLTLKIKIIPVQSVQNSAVRYFVYITLLNINNDRKSEYLRTFMTLKYDFRYALLFIESNFHIKRIQ